MEARVQADRAWRMVLARPGTRPALRSLDREGNPLTWSPEWNAAHDTLLMWPSDTAWLREQRFELREGENVLDTLTYRPVVRMPFYVGLTLGKDTLPGTLRFTATRPLTTVDTAHMGVFEGAERRSVAAVLDTAAPRTLRIRELTPGKAKRELVLFPGALTDRYRSGNDTLRFPLGTAGDQGSGELQVTVEPNGLHAAPEPAVLQLIDAGGRVSREFRSAQWPVKVFWRNVAPEGYSLRLIDDRNGDGKWTTGSYAAGFQPERTFRYAAPVTVRADWTVEIIWPVKP
ncbi:MAG: hypothetical protein QM724_03915 [Flavobacteriales bacterium]